MAVRKIAPRNLPGVRKYFEEQLRDAKKKLNSVNKRRIGLERKIALFQDGLDFCETLYNAAKPKATEVKEGKAAADRFERMIGD
jgi:hypothetical protein